MIIEEIMGIEEIMDIEEIMIIEEVMNIGEVMNIEGMNTEIITKIITAITRGLIEI
jgi:hypothetical protein